jgi:hypothetical protein
MNSSLPNAGRRKAALLASAFACSLALGPVARADEPPDVRLDETVRDGRVTRQELPFAFVVDPSTPSAGVARVDDNVGIGSGISADRPLPVHIGAAGLSNTVGLSYGVTDRLAPFVSGTMSENSPATVIGGLSFQVTQPDGPLRLTVAGAAIHEGLSGANGGFLRVAASLDEGRLRVATNVHGEKIFATGRDQIDVIALLGASYRVTSWLRCGAEYIGQDLEGIAENDEAEGGVRHGVGPDVAIDLDGGRYQLAVATAFGLTANSPSFLLRAALAFNF